MSLRRIRYSGVIESSKSIVNRALILKSIFPQLNLSYISQAQDVLTLEKALQDLKTLKSLESHIFDVESGGTTFRFLSLLLSKYLGRWYLRLSKQLAERPYTDLVHVLNQLGVQVVDQNLMTEGLFEIRSSFWTKNEITVDFAKSSQFFSGVALAASDKPEFVIHCSNRSQSSGYETITLDLLRHIGLEVKDEGAKVLLKNPGITNRPSNINVGADWSSVIYLLSFCFAGADIEIQNIDLKSKEPDRQGLEFLRLLGLSFSLEEGKVFSNLKASTSDFNLALPAVERRINLKTNPDLFPNLMVLVSQYALQSSTSFEIIFPEQLIYKESDRLGVMIDVLKKLGFSVDQTSTDALVISSTVQALELKSKGEFDFDSKKDHRLIMSYELLKAFGYKISYNHKEDVKKSFANFFEIIYG